jgi:glycosyltransferase involved in cell wall biosynthesis
MAEPRLADRPLWLLDDGGVVLGGGQLFALRLARSAGRPVTLVCPADSPLGRAAARDGLAVVDVPFPAPHPAQGLALLRAARRLRSVVPEDAVVLSGAVRASLVAGLARLRAPVVHLLLERDSAARPSVRLALRRSRVLAVGAVATDAYRRALPRARVIPFNNFLAADEVEALAAARRPRDGRVLAVLARMIPEKGVAELVGELAAVPGAWSELRVAGARQDEAYAHAVQEDIIARGLGDRMSLLGRIDDVTAFLRDADVLVVPSTGYEAQPTTIIEGLVAGLPVVCRRPMHSADFAGLPVHPYDGVDDLAAALGGNGTAPVDEIERRFGVGQVLAALDEALA